MKERWRTIVGAEGYYEVSDLGRVRSLVTIGRPAVDGIMAQQSNEKGYKRVHLSAPGRRCTVVVHRLVLEAFVGPAPTKRHECNHKNTIKSDNQLLNLEWLTPKENNAHAVANGRWHPHQGVAHGRAKITNDDVYAIRALHGSETCYVVAEAYGVSATAICRIWNRESWKHLS